MSDVPILTPIATWEPEPGTSVPDQGELHCDTCGRSDFKNTAGLKRHKTIAHGDKSAEKVTVARQVQRDTSGRGAPSVEQLTTATGRLLGYGSIFIASEVVDADPRELSDDEKDRIIDALSATPDEAKEIMRPLSRIFAGTKLNKRVGRKVVDNIDAADSLMALFAMSRRWQNYLSEVGDYKKVNGITRGNSKKATGMKDPYVPVMSSGERVLDGVAAMDNRQGVVVDAAMVEEMRKVRT